MMNKKAKPQRRSLNARIDAELASAENIPLAGIEKDSPVKEDTVQTQEAKSEERSRVEVPTKKATTIMPKEVFVVLQRYCINHDTPKHRALYLFILDGLHAAGEINDADYLRFKDMAEQITTTYEKNKK